VVLEALEDTAATAFDVLAQLLRLALAGMAQLGRLNPLLAAG
jgi:hypothetical protein